MLFIFKNNSLINLSKISSTSYINSEDEYIKEYILDHNEELKINFSLYNVPKRCNINKPLIYLTYNFSAGLLKYNETILIQIQQLIKLEDGIPITDYKFYLYTEKEDEKNNLKLYDENNTELFFNKSINFNTLKISSYGEDYSHRQIEIYFYTVYDDVNLYPKSTLSSIKFELCGYGCNCSSSDLICDKCLDNFVFLDEEREYCHEINKINLTKYVYNENRTILLPCISPCETCENDVSNCTSCIEGYNTIINQTTGKFIKCCPPFFNYLIEFTKECTFECNKQSIYKYYDEKEKNCFKSCQDDNNKYTYNDYLCVEKCPINSYVIENEKKCIFDLKISETKENYIETSMEIDELNEKLDSYLLEYKDLNKSIIGKNYILQVYDINNELSYNNINKIEFSSSFEKNIKEKLKLSENNSLIISKIELLDENSNIKEINISIYESENKTKLDLTKLNDLKYNISYPLNKTILKENLSLINDLYENNIDCLNINDSFFSDICDNNYYNNSYYDLNDKLNDLYINITVCSENCLYKSLKKEENEMKVICECNLSSINNKFIYEESNTTKKNKNSTIDYLKCFKNINFKDLKSNVSFWSYSISTVSVFICMIYSKVQIFNLFTLIANPPKFKKNFFSDNHTNTMDYNNEIILKSSYRLKQSDLNINYNNKSNIIKIEYNHIYKDLILFNSFIDFDNLPYEKIIYKDNRTLIVILFKNLKEKIPLFRCLLNMNNYEIKSIKIIFYFMNISIIFLINIILIGQNINKKKYNDLLIIKTNLIRTIYLFLIYYLLIRITSKIYKKILFKILTYYEYKKNYLNQRKQMKNIIKQNSFTLIFMFIIIFFIIIISAIYVVIYYYIYKHLQTRLILWFLIIFVISFIFSFFISLSISICRYLSIIYKIKSLYNFNLLLKYIFDIY